MHVFLPGECEFYIFVDHWDLYFISSAYEISEWTCISKRWIWNIPVFPFVTCLTADITQIKNFNFFEWNEIVLHWREIGRFDFLKFWKRMKVGNSMKTVFDSLYNIISLLLWFHMGLPNTTAGSGVSFNVFLKRDTRFFFSHFLSDYVAIEYRLSSKFFQLKLIDFFMLLETNYPIAFNLLIQYGKRRN